MYALRSPRILIPAAIALAVVIVGFLAVNSRGDDGKGKLKTTSAAANCPPVARSDAAATKPDEPIAIDVLANDTDADGDPLVFQIVKADGGTATIDDGGTPTDASDDRLLFTPASPAPAMGTVEYEALDPSGGTSSSTVTIAINDTATLPDGLESAFATDPAPAGSQSAKCSGAARSGGPSIPGSGTTTVTLRSTSTTSRSSAHSATTTKKSSKGATTTSGKKSTTTTRHSGTTGSTLVYDTPGNGEPPPTQPHTTTTRRTTTTTADDGSTTTTPTTRPRPDCGSPDSRDVDHYNPNYSKCMNDYYASGP